MWNVLHHPLKKIQPCSTLKCSLFFVCNVNVTVGFHMCLDHFLLDLYLQPARGIGLVLIYLPLPPGLTPCNHHSTVLLVVSLVVLPCTQFSPVTQSCPTLCDPMNRSTPGLLVHHKFPEFTQIHVHPSPSPPALNPSQHQGLFQ